MPDQALYIFIQLASIAYQQSRHQQMRKKMQAEAEKRKGQKFTVQGQAAPLPVVYGKQRIGGINVGFKVNNSYTAPSSENSDQQLDVGFGHTSQSGRKNEFLAVQTALCYEGIDSVQNILVNDIDHRGYTNEMKENNAKFQHRFVIHHSGGTACSAATANGFESTNTFTKAAFATNFYKLNREDPQYSGVPSLGYLVKGLRIKDVTRTQTGTDSNGDPIYSYALTSSRVYSSNPALVLIDYLMNPDFGRGLPESSLDLESFFNAKTICDTTVITGATLGGTVNGTLPIFSYTSSADFPKHTTTEIQDYMKNFLYYDETNNLLYNQTQTGTAPNIVANYGTGPFNSNNIGTAITAPNTENIKLYECNITLNTEDSIRNNIERILNSMGLADLTWTPQGKYKLILNYPTNDSELNALVVPRDSSGNPVTLTEDDIIRDSVKISFNRAQDRFNQVTVNFDNEDEEFKPDTVTFPLTGSSVHNTFLTEDNNQPLTTSMTGEGITNKYHAEAFAEQQVRKSRSLFAVEMRLSKTALILEPGDYIKVTAPTMGLTEECLRVESIEVQNDFTVKVTAFKFDYTILSWLVQNDVAYIVKPTVDFSVAPPTGLGFSSTSDITGTASGKLSWTASNDASVIEYIVEAKLASAADDTYLTLGTTVGTAFDVTGLKTETYTFSVRAKNITGISSARATVNQALTLITVDKVVPIFGSTESQNTNTQSLSPGNNQFVAFFTNDSDDLIDFGQTNADLPIRTSSSVSDATSTIANLSFKRFRGLDPVVAILSNDSHTLPASSAATNSTPNLSGSGTLISVFEGVTQLNHDGVGTSNGTFKVTPTASNCTAGAISDSGNFASVADLSGMTADQASISFLIEGTTSFGDSFSITKTQSFSKAVTGVTGQTGSSAKTVNLTSDDYSLIYDVSGNISSTTVTLTASAQNFNSPEFSFKKNGGSATSFGTSATLSLTTGGSAAINPAGNISANTRTTYSVEVRDGSTGSVEASDSIDVIQLRTAADGEDADNIVSIVMSNEAHVLPASSAGVVTSHSGSGTLFEVFRGSTQLTPTTGTVGSNQFKVTVANDSNITEGAGSVSGSQFVFADHSNMSDSVDAISLTYTLTVRNEANNGNETYTKTQSLSKSKAGQNGSAAKSVRISASSQFFTFDRDNDPSGNAVPDPSSQTINITASLQNTTGSNAFSAVDENGTDRSSFLSTTSGTSCSITEADFVNPNIEQLVITATADGISDSVTVRKLTQGSNLITVLQTNETHVLPCSPTGVVTDYTGSTTDIRVFDGTTELTAVGSVSGSGQYTVSSFSHTESNLAARNLTILTTTPNSLRIGVFSGFHARALNATSTMTITGRSVNGIAFTRTVTQRFSKSIPTPVARYSEIHFDDQLIPTTTFCAANSTASSSLSTSFNVNDLTGSSSGAGDYTLFFGEGTITLDKSSQTTTNLGTSLSFAASSTSAIVSSTFGAGFYLFGLDHILINTPSEDEPSGAAANSKYHSLLALIVGSQIAIVVGGVKLVFDVTAADHVRLGSDNNPACVSVLLSVDVNADESESGYTSVVAPTAADNNDIDIIAHYDLRGDTGLDGNVVTLNGADILINNHNPQLNNSTTQAKLNEAFLQSNPGMTSMSDIKAGTLVWARFLNATLIDASASNALTVGESYVIMNLGVGSDFESISEGDLRIFVGLEFTASGSGTYVSAGGTGAQVTQASVRQWNSTTQSWSDHADTFETPAIFSPTVFSLESISQFISAATIEADQLVINKELDLQDGAAWKIGKLSYNDTTDGIYFGNPEGTGTTNHDFAFTATTNAETNNEHGISITPEKTKIIQPEILKQGRGTISSNDITSTADIIIKDSSNNPNAVSLTVNAIGGGGGGAGARPGNGSGLNGGDTKYYIEVVQLDGTTTTLGGTASNPLVASGGTGGSGTGVDKWRGDAGASSAYADGAVGGGSENDPGDAGTKGAGGGGGAGNPPDWNQSSVKGGAGGGAGTRITNTFDISTYSVVKIRGIEIGNLTNTGGTGGTSSRGDGGAGGNGLIRHTIDTSGIDPVVLKTQTEYDNDYDHANGEFNHSSGLQIRFGSFSSDTDGQQTVTFDTAFSNTALCVITDVSCITSSYTATTFIADRDNDYSNVVTIHYIAIGR